MTGMILLVALMALALAVYSFKGTRDLLRESVLIGFVLWGSVVFISNNLPYKTELASAYIFSLTSSNQNTAASAVSLALLVVALLLLGLFAALSRYFSRGAR